MGLKFKLKSKDEVPAELAGLYVERDGVLVLDVEGAVDQAKLEEFRTTNVALMRERDELNQRFEGIDPDEVRKLADEKCKLEEAQQLKSGEVEKVVETRVRAVKGDLDKRLAGVTAERDAMNARLTAIQIDQAVVTEATKRGLRGSAMPDITARARSAFRLVNGVPQAFEADGQTARVGKDGVTPLSLAEWVDQQEGASHVTVPGGIRMECQLALAPGSAVDCGHAQSFRRHQSRSRARADRAASTGLARARAGDDCLGEFGGPGTCFGRSSCALSKGVPHPTSAPFGRSLAWTKPGRQGLRSTRAP
jgi:hypothetical protein